MTRSAPGGRTAAPIHPPDRRATPVETDEPQFGTVKERVFGRRLGFVPLADLTIGPDELRVAVSKEQVKDAPNIEREGDERFSADESVLRPHYELNYCPPANRQRTSPDEAQHSWEREEQRRVRCCSSTDAGRLRRQPPHERSGRRAGVVGP